LSGWNTSATSSTRKRSRKYEMRLAAAMAHSEEHCFQQASSVRLVQVAAT